MSMAQLVRDMSAAGATPEAIAIAIDAIEAMQSQIDAKRAVERDRKRRQRANTQDMDGTVPGLSRDMDGTVTDAPPLSRPPNENISNPPTHTPPDIYIPREAFPMLDCTDRQTWDDFRRNRKAKRLPCTATAHAKLIADLDKWAIRTGWPPGKVFAACVAKGWGAIYDPTEDDDGRNQQQRPKANGANHVAPDGRAMGRTEAAARAVAARMAGPGNTGTGRAELIALPDAERAHRHVAG